MPLYKLLKLDLAYIKVSLDIRSFRFRDKDYD